MLRPYFVRIKKDLTGNMHIEKGDFPRKSIRFYREGSVPMGKPLDPVFHENALPKVQISKRSQLSAEGKKRFDKILNTQVSTFIYKNFPWDKTKKPREYWVDVDVFQEDVMQTGYESYNSWYTVYKTANVNRSSAKGGTGFWMLAINKLMSGGYHADSGINLFALDELLRKIEEQYDE